MTRPLNYTTTVPAPQTIAECLTFLAEAGAASVSIHYDAAHQPSGLSFSLNTPHGARNFTLPVNVDGCWAAITKMLRTNAPHVSRGQLNKLGSRQHAHDVAWRVVKDWLEATLAIIAAQMATLDEVMLPYLHVDEERTLWQAYREREDALELEAGSG
jgi:hypothetical protein